MFLFLLVFRGYKRFFRRAMLETSNFLKDDCLKIHCTVGVVVSAIDCSRLHSIKVPESDIGAHFGMLLENEECSDITFTVHGEKIHAHKLVLAARSPVFESEFFDSLEEDNREIVVTDMEPKVFKVSKDFPSSCFYLFLGNEAFFLLMIHIHDEYVFTYTKFLAVLTGIIVRLYTSPCLKHSDFKSTIFLKVG